MQGMYFIVKRDEFSWQQSTENNNIKAAWLFGRNEKR